MYFFFFSARRMELKEDVLHCTTAELSYGLCCFINEVKRPNGKPYSPDSLFYLCLGIQQARYAKCLQTTHQCCLCCQEAALGVKY